MREIEGGRSQRALLERAAAQLHEARVRLEALERERREAIAILGASVRLPGGIDDTAGLWSAICERRVAVRPLIDGSSGDRSEQAPLIDGRWAGLLDRVDSFDADFFGLNEKEATQMDPQQRLVLEVAWEAIEDAGLPLEALRQQTTGVYVGLYGIDYVLLQQRFPERIDAYTGAGSAHSIAANRLSYQLDLRGPSLAVDTACSSSLAALHLACRGLRARDCDVAIVAGVNAILAPISTYTTERALPLAPGGECRPFDASSEGIVRSEGCGAVVLQRQGDAREQGLDPRALIAGSAMNQDGRTNGMTAPSPSAQRQVIEKALADAGADASEVVYVEAHGTGTRLGDPIEAGVLVDTYGEGALPCCVGSLKANLGHLEAAAGIAGLVKAMLVLEKGEIPPQGNFDQLGPGIDFADNRLEVASRLTPLPRDGKPPKVAVSSFGFGGSNVHVVLQAAPADATGAEEPGILVLPISARAPGALVDLARAYAESLEQAGRGEVAEICAAAAVRRSHHSERLCCVGASGLELRDEILARATTPASTGRRRDLDRRLVFVFCGQGSQWPRMGAAALESEPVLRAEVLACDEEVRALAGWSVVEQLRSPEAESQLADTEVAQVVIASLQFGLLALLESWGLAPDAVVGHSMGEIVAACAAGHLTRADAFGILLRRAQVIESRARGGRMVHLSASERQVQELIDRGGGAAIAAVNGPASTVVSGRREAVENVVAAASEMGIRTRVLPVDYGFHSPLLEGAEIGGEAPGVNPKGTCELYSTVTGGAVDPGQLDAHHWDRNLRDRVRFWEAIASLRRKSAISCVEIGPRPTLTPGLQREFSRAEGSDLALCAMRKSLAPALATRRCLADLYEAGHEIRWDLVIAPPRRRVSLPAYPWQRRRYWLGDGDARTEAHGPLEGLGFPTVAPRSGSKTGDTSPDDLFDLVRRALVEALALEGLDEIQMETPLESLGVDSAMLVEIRGTVEAGLGAEVPLQELLDAETVGDVIAALASPRHGRRRRGETARP